MNKTSLLSVIIALTALASVFVLQKPQNTADRGAETVFERVMRTQIIRCGYISAPPLLIKDPNTGRLSGVAYDVAELLGKQLGLKIDWTEEVGWGTFPSALASRRFDAFCVGAWPSAARSRSTDSTVPFSYQPYYAYVRAGDGRFMDIKTALNTPTTTLSVMDGDTSAIIASSDFPKAKTVSLTESANVGELLLNVVTGKADATFIDPAMAAKFDANNPGKIQRLADAPPIRVFGNVFFIAQNQDAFRRMLDTTLEELLSSGQIENIIARYEAVPGTILRVAPKYAR